MLFNSLSYLLFLSIVFILYWIINKDQRIYFLTLASFIFYGFWEPAYLIVIIVISVVDYLLAIQIARSEIITRKRFFLVISIVANLALLISFKYLYFFISNLNMLGLQLNADDYNFMLPLGISFFTFEAISYNVDIYRNHFKPEKNYIYYFCFIAFFPKLIAGPVLRAKDLIPQLKSKVRINWTNIEIGLQRIVVGLFLKVVIADNISNYVDKGFLIPNNLLSAFDVWTLSFIFGIQIYLDFAAYSTIAIGSSRLFGIIIPENFNFPYLVINPREFWQKWHISLSLWIKDYLYVPLLKSFTDKRKKSFHDKLPAKKRWVYSIKNRNFALLITWAIMGFWHGAEWTFIIWGLIHGFLILFYRLFGKIWNYNKNIVSQTISHIFTLCVVMLAWIPFRSSDLNDVFEKYKIIGSIGKYDSLMMQENIYLVTFVLMVGIYLCWFLYKPYLALLKKTAPRYAISFVIGLTMIPLIIAFLRPINQFIYFQF